VVARGDHEALSDLLTSDTTSVCAIDKEGNTVLHCAVASACQNGDSEESFYQCIDLLMSCEQMKINRPNKKGYTAIGLAVHQLCRTCIELMLKHDSAKRLHLDYYPGDSESTVRKIIMETYPDLVPRLPETLKDTNPNIELLPPAPVMETNTELQPLLPAPVMESLDSSERDIKLLAALLHDKDIFSKHLSQTNPNPSYGEPYYSSLLEIACQMENGKGFVELLLVSGADPNTKNSFTGMPLIHLTARSGNLDVLKILLEYRNVDASVTDNKNRTILHWLAKVSGKNPGDKERIERCFKLVQNSCTNTIFDLKDDEENTALYIAAKSGFKDRVLLLLKRGANIMLSIHGTPILSSVSTPMLEEILDDCLECNDEPQKSEALELTFNYQILHKIIPHMAECPHQRELLKHPVTLCFINLYYVHFTVCNFIKLFLYFISLLLLAFNVILVIFGLQTTVLLFATYEAVIISYFLLFSWFSNVRCFRTWEIFLSLPMLLHAFGSANDDYRNYWIWTHVVVICHLLAWLKLVVMIGRLPWEVVKKEMFKRVSCTFLKYMAGYYSLLITLPFTVFLYFKVSSIQAHHVGISELFHSILTPIVMFTGEFNFANIRFELLPVTSHVIFLLCVFLGPIILLNLLNGLAVYDTQELRRDAETMTLVAKVRIIKENNWQEHFRPNEMKEGKILVYPNRWKPPVHPLLGRFIDFPGFSHCIRSKRQKSMNPKSTEEKLTAMEQKFDIILKEIQETLNKIVTRLDIRE
jgi:ankyrin repeat protein